MIVGGMYIYGMSRRYSIAEARTRLPTIIDQAEAGQEIELTRRGKPVAVVVSARELERLRGGRAGFGEAYRSFLEKHALDEVGVEEDFAASLRAKGPGRDVPL
jgi:prevent-host-death family protein